MKDYSETYDFLMSVIGNAPYGIMTIDSHGKLLMCNELALAHFNIQQLIDEIIGKEMIGLIGGLPELLDKMENYIQEGPVSFDLVSLPFEDKFLTIKGRPVSGGMIFTTEDVTKVKHMEMNAMNAMLKGQEAERRRIAKEIHDGIGPLMSTIKLLLDALRTDLSEEDRKSIHKIENTLELVNTVATEIRSISHDLMPHALVDFGVVPALENLCFRANGSGKMSVNFFQSGMKNRLDQGLALNIYRIAQELLNNAIKYSQAKTINVQLIRHSGSLVLMVEDDGIGFDPKNLKTLITNGIGLRNVKTRVKSLGGTFTLESQSGRGVLATIEVPNAS